MKKIALVFVLATVIASCKKKDPAPATPVTPATEAYCIYEVLPQNKKKFLECVPNTDQLTKKVVEYRNNGVSTSSIKKSTCSDC